MKILYSAIIFFLTITFVSAQSYFKPIPEESIEQSFRNSRSIVPEKYQVAQLSIEKIKKYLIDNITVDGEFQKITVINPEGDLADFIIKEVNMMESEITARYPSIRTYKGYNPENKAEKIHLGISPTGFYASVASPSKSYAIDRYADKEDRFYISYYLKDFKEKNAMSYSCGTLASEINHSDVSVSTRSAGENLPLRTYRFALACTGEFGSFYGPSKEDVLSEMMKSVNRMNLILENDFAVRLIIINDNDKIIWTDPDTDPYPDGNTGHTLLGENTKEVSDEVGFANFDIGHIYTRGCDDTGGVAFLQSACAANKGGGVTCHSNTDITATAVRVAAHEVGHQLGSQHTFNNCNGNESSSTAYEPGSGSTIMSYGGLCGPTLNVVNVSDDYYHISSLLEVTQYTRAQFGNSCATFIETSNNIPDVTIPIDGGFSIPISTPFELTGEASDENGDELTYNWEQFNLGPKTTPGDPINNSPIFISDYPSSNPTRVFPNLSTLVSNGSNKTEVLPTYDRDLNFQFIVRDNNAESGGVAWEEIEFYASESAGPFLVTYPDTSDILTAGSEIEIKWDVANTDNEIINCKSVDILISTDGGFTYPDTLLSETPNDGIELVFVPNIITSEARIKVKASNNIFFDISNKNFTIEEPSSPGFIFSYTPSYVRNCVPNEVTLNFETEALLGYNEPITFKVVSGIVEGMEVNFSKEQINPGESNVATITFPNTSLNGNVDLEIEAQTASDTLRRNISLELLSTDFSDISPVFPVLGTSGNLVSPVLTWTPDVDAENYIVRLSDNPSFSSELSTILYEETVQDTFFELDDILLKSTVYYWSVTGINECGESLNNEIYTFATEALSCSTYVYNDVPLGISQSGVIIIEMPIDIIGEGNVSDVNIRKIRGTHSWVSELKGEIISPSGLSVLLFNNKCGNQADFNAGFDDDATSGITCPLNQGKFYQPEARLDTFNGEPIAGVWTLKLTDTKIGNGGTVQEYILELCSNAVLESPFIVNNVQMPLPSGVGRRITSEFLLSEDNNNGSEDLIYTIVKLPENGNLLNGDENLVVGSQISQLEISNNQLRYLHNGGEEGDVFEFTVEDGEGGWISNTEFEIVIDNSVVLGVNDLNKINFQVFPNPTSGKFTIVFDEGNQDASMDILDVSGRKVGSSIISNSNNIEVNIEGMEKGVYFIVVTGEQFQGVQKIVVE